MRSDTVPEQRVSPLISLPPAGLRDARPGLSGVPADELDRWLSDRGQPAYRARQLSDHVWSAAAQTSEQLSTFPQRLRTELDETFRIDTLAETDITRGRRRPDREGAPPARRRRLVESVLMRYPARGLAPRARHGVHLEPGRLRGRLSVLRHRRAGLLARPRRRRDRRPGALLAPAGWPAEGRRLTNVVFMGMGEPLLNADRVLAAAAALSDPQRFGLGARHITISTSGVVPGMERLITSWPAVHAGGVAPRRAAGAARRARAAQPALARSARSWPRPTGTPRRPAGASRTSS